MVVGWLEDSWVGGWLEGSLGGWWWGGCWRVYGVGGGGVIGWRVHGVGGGVGSLRVHRVGMCVMVCVVMGWVV